VKIIDQLRKLRYPIKAGDVALRLGKSTDHATNIMRKARDYELITLEAHGLYWPTKKLQDNWRK